MDQQPPKHTRDVAAMPEAWALAYQTYFTFWLNLARSLSGSEDEAKDLVQGVVTTVMTRRVFESQEHIRNYVARAILNRVIESRKEGARRERWAEYVENTIPHPEELSNAERQTELNVLRTSVRALAPKDFQIIKLRFYAGLTFEEISNLINVPISTLKSREDAALKKIRKTLRKNGV